jgi:predicted nucleotide-binding protein (sugar kinase/HSP70/actin superfamily)
MVANVSDQTGQHDLSGRTVYIPDMAYAGARLTAAAFRSIGVAATVTPDSNGETLELGGLFSSGEECLPHKITLGNFLRVCRQPGAQPHKIAFFMPLAPGPCRFGQYAPYLRQVLEEQGLGDVLILSPNSASNYREVGEHGPEMIRTAWLGIVAGDLVTRLLLKTRPYELHAGDTDAAFAQAVETLAQTVARSDLSSSAKSKALAHDMAELRQRFRAIPARYEKGRPFIGVVGEIFCRLNTFSNDDAVRRVEKLGGECWLSDVTEWLWYTDHCRGKDVVRDFGRLSWPFLKHKIRSWVQHRFEHTIMAPLAQDLRGYEEPHDIGEVLADAEPYLPPRGSEGEMTLSVGKSVYLYRKGIDGVIDISPFTCMNGIVSEAVYPALSADHDNLPIRSLYFDKASTNVDRDIEIFLDLARAYQRRKRHQRVYPDYFK